MEMTDLAPDRSRIERWQHRLLPGELVERPGGRRLPRDWLVDAALFLLAVAVGVGSLAETWSDRSSAALAADVVLGAAACLALWFRRRHVVAVALLAVPVSAFSAMAAGAAAVAVFNVAVRGSRRAIAAVAALAVVAFTIHALLVPEDNPAPIQVLLGVLVVVVAVGWGLFTRARRELVSSLRERAERLEAEQRLRVEQAREAERRQIAREMHDVLAHRISLLSVHAGALEFRPDAPPEEVAEAAGVIRAAAHAALQELRAIVGVLRDDADVPPEPPQPTLADIPVLVEESRSAGMRVRSRIDLPAGEAIPSAVGRTAYRVVQEGLTNARKHAPAAAVDVSLSVGEGSALVVAVVSRPSVGVAARTAPGRAQGPEPMPGAGTGLVGLAERVALTGGKLQHGPDADGDFVLRAIIPWTP
jgi:signal transduction histidine kinase